MTIENILKKVHRKFAKDTDYPVAGSEELLVRIDHADDAISEYEDCVKEGYNFRELMTSATQVFGGTGTDALPTNFLSFIHHFGDDGYCPAELVFAGATYQAVKASEGREMVQDGLSPGVFWEESGSIRTLPAITGSITLPYLQKHTRYVTGAETDEPEMANPKFIEDFVTAKVFLDNDDNTLYSAYMTQANEKLSKMKYDAII